LGKDLRRKAVPKTNRVSCEIMENNCIF